MSTMRNFRKYAAAAAVMTAIVVTDGWLAAQSDHPGLFVSKARAEVGRPLTPGSVAGVARRTTRRTIRRSTVYVGALPGGCVRATVSGVALWRCGGTYYQSHAGRYVVVYVN